MSGCRRLACPGYNAYLDRANQIKIAAVAETDTETMTRIFIYDTTLRDGSQGEGVNFSLQDKLLITARLDEAGFDYIEGGYPLSNPKDAAYFRAVRDLDLKHAKVAAFGMTRRRDIAAEDDQGMKALVSAGTPAITIVGKSWDLHVHDVLGVSLDENLRMIARLGRLLRLACVRSHLRRRAFLRRFQAQPRLRAAHHSSGRGRRRGLDRLVRHQRRAPCPMRSPHAVSQVAREVSVPLGIHTHNDGDLAVANALAAVRHGALQVQGTINGLGERCGNVDLCSVVGNLALKYPDYSVLSPGKLEHLTELSRYVYETANMNFRASQPFVGASAFAHKGGMHVHGVRKNAASYEHIDPATVGNERRVLISELSGKSNIAEKLSEYGLEQDGELLARVLDRVQDLENEGYQFEAAEASFVLLVERLADRHRPWFDVARAFTSASAEISAGSPRRRPRRPSSSRSTACSNIPSARETDRSMRSTVPCGKLSKGTIRVSRR